MRILLLGASGFVGTNVAKVLNKNNLEFDPVSKSNGFDLRSFEETENYFMKSKPDYVINCAAHVGSLNYVTEKAADVISDNTKMILSMYAAIAKNCPKAKIINPIANCAYPANAETFIEDNWWNGHLHRSVLSYGSTRRLLWTVGESYMMQYGIKSYYLLVPNMYGPFDSTDPNKAHALNALISKFVKAKNEGRDSISIWGTGVAIREWLYAEDFGNIILKILKNPQMIGLDEPVNIAQNFGLSVRELVSIIQEEFQYQGKIHWDHNMPDGAPKKVMDDGKFKKVFKDFEFTDFNIGIKNTVAYYNSVYPY